MRCVWITALGMLVEPEVSMYAVGASGSMASIDSRTAGVIGVRKTSAERAARADRIVRDMTRNDREKLPERIDDHGFVERGVAHAGADRERFPVARKLV